VGFAIPSNVAKRISDDLIATGEATHGVLGVLVENAMSSEDGSAFPVGARILELTPGGAAEGVGLRPGDVIVSFDGRSISSSSELTGAVRQESSNTAVKIDVLRDGQKLVFYVVL
jgi:putative serine protease PepD